METTQFRYMHFPYRRHSTTITYRSSTQKQISNPDVASTNTHNNQKVSPTGAHSSYAFVKETNVNKTVARGKKFVGNDDNNDDDDECNHQQHHHHQHNHQEILENYDFNQEEQQQQQQQPQGAAAAAVAIAVSRRHQRKNQRRSTLKHRRLPTRHLVSAACIQQYLNKSDGISIRPIPECIDLVQSINDRGVVTKDDLRNFVANRMNHRNNGNDDDDDEIHHEVDALIDQLHLNLSERNRFPVPVLIEFNSNAFGAMSSNEIDAFLRNYDFSADNLHPLDRFGLQYFAYPTQHVYDSEAVCSRPLDPAAHLPGTHKVMIGLGPHTPQPEQIAFIVASMCDVQLLGLPTVGSIKAKANRNRAPTIKTPFVYLEVATLAEANRIIATFHHRVILDEGGWWFARTDAEIAALHRYSYGMLSQQAGVRYQHRPYLPLTASLFRENTYDRSNALVFDGICAITNPNGSCAAFRQQHQNTNFARVDYYCYNIQHIMFDDAYFDGRMLPTHANMCESDAWYKVLGLDPAQVNPRNLHAHQDNDGTFNLKYPAVSKKSANICFNNAVRFWPLWSNSPVVPFSQNQCLCNGNRRQQ